MSKDSLFSDFQSVSKKAWLEKIEKDLKGKPYSDLQKTNASGLDYEAAYHREDLNVADEAPGRGSFRRGSKTQSNAWVVDELLHLSGNHDEDNKSILAVLNAGLTGITIDGNPNAQTLKGILPEYITLAFQSYDNIKTLGKTIHESWGSDQNNYAIHLNFDPIGMASSSGKWNNQEIEHGIQVSKELESYSLLRTFSVSAQNYHNAGGNAVSELAFALAHAHEYLVALLNAGYSIDDASAKIKINLASGRDYFNELAKFRAFRILWAQLIDAYKPEHNCSKTALIHAIGSQYLSTLYDPHVNMLRGTTQGMAAVLGGCDILRVLPFDTAWTKGDDFSKRIARNVQLLMQEESYFDKVIDPAGGSYYIEELTNKLASKAWAKFQKIEAKGGFIGLMTSGNLARELREDAEEQGLKLQEEETKVLGVTLYPNPNESMIDELKELESVEASDQTDFTPIDIHRLVGSIEEARLNDEITAEK